MLRIFLTALICVLSLPAFAQEYNKTIQAITEINRMQPQQNPNYERADKILTRRVLDRKNHVVGMVQDVIFRSNGGLKSLKVQFDRLRLTQPVFLNYHELDVRTGGRSYQLSFDDDQIGSLYPQLLADIETAGGAGSDEFSLQKTLGASVVTANGNGVGTIDDVLFSAEGDRVEVFYVRMTGGPQSGKQVAIPVDSVNLAFNGENLVATASDDLARAMNDYAATK